MGGGFELFNPLASACLAHDEFGCRWSISAISGALLQRRSDLNITRKGTNLPRFVREQLKFIDKPYSLKVNSVNEYSNTGNDPIVSVKLLSMYNSFSKIKRISFLGCRIYASFSKILFNSTQDAFAALNKIPPIYNSPDKECLAKCILAVKTSKSFRNNGILVIGSLLPSTSMHCWIIENGNQWDLEDRDWINYRPLLVMWQT